MPKLLIITQKNDEYESLIRAANLPDLEILSIQDDKRTSECDIVLGEPARIREHLPALKNLRWVQSIWAGVEPLLAPNLRRDYTLTNARGVFGELMTEYIFGYLLAHERRIFKLRQAQVEKYWDGQNNGTLRGKTIGLLGVGSIGAEVARTAKHFKMNVRGYTHSSETSSDVDMYYHDNLLEFVDGLDYLVNILPNTPSTRKLLDASVFQKLRKHVLFINVGRGSAVDEDALEKALREEKIAGAILDVFSEEPLPKEHPFWTTPNLLMTFHTAALSLPVYIVDLFVENYHRYLKGDALNYQVDFERGY
ncbi:MAG: D-2-hydroxyacid dehydrogenase [Anaerolineae bacterium]|jgi:phosphoglycerate dehydrogenase-like enzyme|nr:D-2-hydroxyacid dehydrogenase [Anaerolineae bacterium]MBT7071732.1 D-2-hydroxyacid dehydrogenase [Anaerolineae bacterium]MBT7325610.1 D-2-hydroxyacid dehydrogenase [Anaerolineae bacterium]